MMMRWNDMNNGDTTFGWNGVSFICPNAEKDG